MYRTIDTEIWIDRKVKKLDTETKLLWVYLLTNSHTHISGLYYLPVLFMHHETGVPTKGVQRGLEVLIELEMIAYDFEDEVVWIINMLRRQKGATPETNINVRKSIQNQIESFKKCGLSSLFIEEYKDLNLDINSPLKVPSKGLARAPVTVTVTDSVKEEGIVKGGNSKISSESKKLVAEYMEWEYYPKTQNYSSTSVRDTARRSCTKLLETEPLEKIQAALIAGKENMEQSITAGKMKQPYKVTNFFGKDARWMEFIEIEYNPPEKPIKELNMRAKYPEQYGDA